MVQSISSYVRIGLGLCDNWAIFGNPNGQDVFYRKLTVLCLTLDFITQQNYSFSGALRPLSKVIICMVMLRGRHRDLPQAIDRASAYLLLHLRFFEF